MDQDNKQREAAPLGNASLTEKFAVLLMFSLLLIGVYFILKPFIAL